MKDYFISYHSADIEWAEWTASTLEKGGYTILLHAWDSSPVGNFFKEISHNADLSKGVIILLSQSYLDMPCSVNEWFSFLESISESKDRNLLSIKVGNCSFYSLLLESTFFIDLVGLKKEEAKKLFLQAVELCKSMVPEPKKQLEEKSQRYIKAMPRIWNIPYYKNLNFWGRESILVNIRSMLISEKNSTARLVIHGIGGVGKTHIAVEYAYRYVDEYHIVWWVRSENQITITSDLINLCNKLNLAGGKEKDPESIIKTLLDFLEKDEDWLLIFDNAEDPEIIRNYCPNTRNGYVLITSRHTSWDNLANTIALPVMNRKESIELLERLTCLHDDKASRELVELLGDLPLALEQVGFYIKENAVSISDYLEQFKKSKEDLAKLTCINSDYPQSVATTFNISFEQLEKHTPDALNMMYLFSFLAPELIPLNFIESWWPKVEKSSFIPESHLKNLKTVLAKLSSLSLINLSKKTISIHR
ncbi:TIR domain-containing protein, partial [bacterium]|nr:TIR domain-containing protein [bacterium]